MSNVMDIVMSELKQPLWENWYIKEVLGYGASSSVYRIEAERSGRTDVSALKVEPITTGDILFSDPERKRQYLERKRQEAVNETNIMYKLRKCPYIVGYEEEDIREVIHEGEKIGYCLLIRMEYLQCLQTLMQKGKLDCSEGNIIKIAKDIGRGIQAAHKIGIIHRDIKPANFFVGEEGIYKLGDFNISKLSPSAKTFAGTDGYIAPEVYYAKKNTENSYTRQADIYSFGICLYQLMNNYFFPYEDKMDTLDEALDRRLKGDETLPPPKKASPEFAAVILKACAFDAAERYATIDDMLRDIDALGTRPAPEAIPAPPVQEVPLPKPPADTEKTVYLPKPPAEEAPFNAKPAENITVSQPAATENVFFTNPPQSGKKSSKKAAKIAAIAAAAVLLVGGGIFFLTRNSDKEDRKGTPAVQVQDGDPTPKSASGEMEYEEKQVPSDYYKYGYLVEELTGKPGVLVPDEGVDDQLFSYRAFYNGLERITSYSYTSDGNYAYKVADGNMYVNGYAYTSLLDGILCNCHINAHAAGEEDNIVVESAYSEDGDLASTGNYIVVSGVSDPEYLKEQCEGRNFAFIDEGDGKYGMLFRHEMFYPAAVTGFSDIKEFYETVRKTDVDHHYYEPSGKYAYYYVPAQKDEETTTVPIPANLLTGYYVTGDGSNGFIVAYDREWVEKVNKKK